jgi:WD40-like Beta Propeller Repeat
VRSFVLCTYLVACTQVVQLAPDPLGNLVTIELTPNDATLTITDLAQAPQSLGYHAIGVFSDGSRRDITTMLNWSVDNMAPGGFLDPGTYTTSNAAAGHVGVTARSNDGVIATAALTVIVDATVIDPAYPGDPTLFDPSIPIITGDPSSPSYVYPSDGTELPQGVASTLFQAAVGSGDTLELTFDADVLHLAVITTANRWDTGTQIQQLLALSSIGSPIQCGIEAVATPGTIYGGAPIALTFDASQPAGSIYYWSAATNGIMLGALSSPSAPKLFPGDASCVGCHSASRDGQSIGMAYGSESMPLLQTIDADTLATTIDRAQMLPGGWSTFSPDRTMVLVAGSGQLELRDAQTGAPIGGTGSDGKIALPVGHYATHPDWSPDGNSIAIAYTTTPPTDLSVGSASIAVLPYKGSGTFGTPITLVTAVGLDNNYFPRYSPDGSFIAYVHATEPSEGAASAELWLVPSSGGTPIALEAASHTVSSMTSVANTADTMPAWAPMASEHTYLAFASSRPYGVVLPSGGQPQIWVSAIDLTNATPDADPSQPAFWLPCQDVTVLNNNPVWTFDSTAPQ